MAGGGKRLRLRAGRAASREALRIPRRFTRWLKLEASETWLAAVIFLLSILSMAGFAKKYARSFTFGISWLQRFPQKKA